MKCTHTRGIASVTGGILYGMYRQAVITTCAVAFLVFAFLIPHVAHAANIYLETEGDTYGPGDTFVVTVRLDNENECINAGRIILHYPEEVLKAVDFGRGDSLFSLWINDPILDNETGQVVFEGGIPGGYCGRIQGDPALSNVLGRAVFTVISNARDTASITPSLFSELYISDGLGTKTEVSAENVTITIIEESVGAPNEWLASVQSDDIPPDPFAVRIESTAGVFNGNYYAVFSTVDKQSGLSHYEIFERGVWQRISSPYQIRDQSLREELVVRAIDKAGNERVANFDPATVPERLARPFPTTLIGSILAGLILLGLVFAYFEWRQRRKERAES